MTEYRHNGKKATVSAFAVAFLFFQFAYPYHLMRREQISLFMFDGNYISQTYRGAGWLSRLLGDFIDQFLHFPVAGPILIALILTAIAVFAYKIARRFLGERPSMATAAAVFIWAILRETGNLQMTRYSLAIMCYLYIILCFIRLHSWWRKTAFIPVIALCIWALGSPYDAHYGKMFNTPSMKYERMIGMDVELTSEKWDKVLKLTEKDYHVIEESYCYNLANAMKGELSRNMFKYSQNRAMNSLFIWVSDKESEFSNSLAGEVWYHMGDMTLAEQSAIIALQSSPYHTGTKYLQRLAKINIISGQEDAARKYLRMLSKTLVYRRWARMMLSGEYDESTEAWLEEARAKLVPKDADFVYSTNDMRPVLQNLLEADPDNDMAREYLLCYDLLRLDLDSFMEDYSPEKTVPETYQEAVLIWLTLNGKMSEAEAEKYGVSRQIIDKLDNFYRFPDSYKGTYWYYYVNAE